MNNGPFRESAGMDTVGVNCGQLCTHPYACKDGCLRRTGPHPKIGRYAYGAEDREPHPMTEPDVLTRELAGVVVPQGGTWSWLVDTL